MDTNILKGSADEYFPTMAGSGHATRYDVERTAIAPVPAIASVPASVPTLVPAIASASVPAIAPALMPVDAGYDPYQVCTHTSISADYLQALETLAQGMLQLIPYEELVGSTDITWETFVKLVELRGHNR